MSTNKFLDLMVFIEDQKWTVSPEGKTRNEKDQCPLSAIVDVLSFGKIQETWAAWRAWDEFVNMDVFLMFDEREISEIMDAADRKESYLRKELMEALHIS